MIFSVPAFAKNFDEKRLVVGTIGDRFENDLVPFDMDTSDQFGKSECGGHENSVQLLEKKDDTANLSTVLEIDDTKTESCQQKKTSGVVSGDRSATELVVLGKKGQRRNFSSMTKVLVDFLQQLNTWIPHVLIAGIEQFASEDPIFWKCVCEQRLATG